MSKTMGALVICSVSLISAARAEEKTALPPGYGPSPQLVAPQTSFIPTVNVAKAVGWKDGGKPSAASDLAVTAYAKDLNHPRWFAVLPNGDVLVAETNAPPKPEDGKGIKGWFMKYFMSRAGAGVKSPNQITLLRGVKPDGTAAERHVFLSGLESPFGMALVGDTLYVANADALVKFPYNEGVTSISEKATKVADLPGGPINHHWTKNVIANADGSKLYVTVGSNSNIGENGMEVEKDRAAILEIDAKTGSKRVFASGIRNPNGLGWEPKTKVLWTVSNERDELGNDLVPDYLTSVKDGAFYGWPYSYFGQHVDDRVQPQNAELVAKAIPPDYGLGAHTASLGLTFSSDKLLPKKYAEGVFIGQHGSWNRKPASGYKVIFVPFKDGKPNGMPEDVLTGFLDKDGQAQGRPVGVAIAADGSLLVADDVGNTIWRLTPAQQQPS